MTNPIDQFSTQLAQGLSENQVVKACSAYRAIHRICGEKIANGVSHINS